MLRTVRKIGHLSAVSTEPPADDDDPGDGPVAGDGVITENDSGFILLEDGSFLLLE